MPAYFARPIAPIQLRHVQRTGLVAAVPPTIFEAMAAVCGHALLAF